MLLLALFCGVWAIGLVFIACELSQRFSNAFSGLENSLIHIDWHLYPMEVQRLMPIIMMFAQQEMEFECFGSLSCSRAAFKAVGL